MGIIQHQHHEDRTQHERDSDSLSTSLVLHLRNGARHACQSKPPGQETPETKTGSDGNEKMSEMS